MTQDNKDQRHIGLFGATSIGVGAIVGGGILALAGVAFQSAGPSAILSFALNAIIALITALSFAEMASAFPKSGGTYAFAKRVYSVQMAFYVGWIVWFASIVAAVLYALGFSTFAHLVVVLLWPQTEAVISRPALQTILAVIAVLYYLFTLTRGAGGGGGQWINTAKMGVFLVLIFGGIPALFRAPAGTVSKALQPFFHYGPEGMLAAMGFTFIAFQGFDLIAAVSGEIKDPGQTIPKAMVYSLGAAVAVYLPLLFVVATVGIPEGESVVHLATVYPETMLAVAIENYLGRPGYWLVVAAALLSMLSALQANLLAASHIAYAMGVDRTLPAELAETHAVHKTPVKALVVSALTVVVIVIVVPGVAVAGAAASLIFLISFALTQRMALLARARGAGALDSFRVPFYPWLPRLGLLLCVALALFQAFSVPTAGVIVALWLVGGGVLYAQTFERRALVADAAAEAFDPDLIKLRGRIPVVLVPIANPENAAAMVEVAQALTPASVGRVLLLTVALDLDHLATAQETVRQALMATSDGETSLEALTTVANEPWKEIGRVFDIHRCESLLLGLSRLEQLVEERNLEDLVEQIDTDVVILRAPKTWQARTATRVLVPVGGLGGHDALRARFLNSLRRTNPELAITYLAIAKRDRTKLLQRLDRVAQDEVGTGTSISVVSDLRPTAEVLSEHAQEYDLVILGLQRQGKQKVIGEVTLEVARRTETALVIIGHRS